MKNLKKSMLKISHTIKPESEGMKYDEWVSFIAAQKERYKDKPIKSSDEHQENLNMSNVTLLKEQLFDFLEYCDNAGWIKNVDKKRIIDDYEKAKNLSATKVDLLTGETFVPKRSNQKFASDSNRIAYNNKKARESRKEIEYLEKPLYRNYKILREIMEDANQRCFHKQFLIGKGFDFKVYNSMQHYEGKSHYAVYDYIIVKADKTEEVKIVRNVIDG